jgi:hypothetical protein
MALTPEDRRKKALALALAGVDFQTIAVQCGYDDRSDAVEDVSEALTENPIDDLEPGVTRKLQVARLSRLLAAVWPSAISGNNRSVEVSSRLVQQLCRMQGIEEDSKADPKMPKDPVEMSAYDELAARRPGSLGGPRREGNGRRRGRRTS